MDGVVITGGRGQLGRELDVVLNDAGISHLCLDLPEYDITDTGSIVAMMIEYRPALVIHTAAYTNVDLGETDRTKAASVNAHATAGLAGFCAAKGIPLAYISTDFVFDGLKTMPYETDDRPNPLNVYGATKLQGEEKVRASGGPFWIVRTSWLFGVYGENFPKAILRLAAKGQTPRVVSDQVGSPTHAGDLAFALCQLTGILPRMDPVLFGIYHYANAGSCSWYEFAIAILEYSGWLKVDPGLRPVPITGDKLQRPARRPAYSVLSVEKATTAGLRIRDWREGLRSFLTILATREPALFPSVDCDSGPLTRD